MNNWIVVVYYLLLMVYVLEVGKVNGMVVIFCFGGGYVWLVIGEGGGYEMKWLI